MNRKSIMEDFEGIKLAKTELGIDCLHCGSSIGVDLEDSRTQYPDDNANQPIRLCRTCAKEHHEYWDEMWREYYAGRL